MAKVPCYSRTLSGERKQISGTKVKAGSLVAVPVQFEGLQTITTIVSQVLNINDDNIFFLFLCARANDQARSLLIGEKSLARL